MRNRSHARGYARGVEDLGPPIAYTLLPEGVPVFDRNGNRTGVVDEIVADFQVDVFEGLVVHTLPLPGRHLFASPEQIESMHERGVVLAVEAADLPEHGPSAERRRKEEEPPRPPLAAWFARAWDRVMRRR